MCRLGFPQYGMRATHVICICLSLRTLSRKVSNLLVWLDSGTNVSTDIFNCCNMLDLSSSFSCRRSSRKVMLACRFNTVGVSDAISMGTDGMSYSLQSRDLIADSIETTMAAQWYDGNVSIPGCDKNMPGTVIAMARLNRPAIMIYGGTIKPGYSQITSDPIDIVSAFQSYGTLNWCQTVSNSYQKGIAAKRLLELLCCRPGSISLQDSSKDSGVAVPQAWILLTSNDCCIPHNEHECFVLLHAGARYLLRAVKASNPCSIIRRSQSEPMVQVPMPTTCSQKSNDKMWWEMPVLGLEPAEGCTLPTPWPQP